MSYEEFLRRKSIKAASVGVGVSSEAINPQLFEFQRTLVQWALRKGRSAIFADTGLGKTAMQLSWAEKAAERCIILAPLAVAHQTVREGERFGIPVTYARTMADAPATGITITNYEMLKNFDASAFGAVVLDESSILKSFDGKTRTALIEAFGQTPMRLACTATPAPNDTVELGNHAEFLGVMSVADMKAMFFKHEHDKGNDYVLKGHAREAFYRWVASWGMVLKRPSDLGYSDDGYDLPGLTIEPRFVGTDYTPEGQLFATELKGVGHRAKVRRETLEGRVAAAVNIIEEENTKNGRQEQGEPEGVYEALVGREPGPRAGVQGCDEGTAQRQAPGTVCTGRGAPHQDEGASQAVAGREPGKTEGPEAQDEGHRALGVSRPDGSTESSVCNLRPLGHVDPELLPACGSLPLDGSGARDSLHELQPGHRQVQGRPDPADGSCRVSQEKWLVWCGLNAEQDAIFAALKEQGISAVSIDGRTGMEERLEMERAWRLGDVQVLISKPSVFGFGMNWQHCARQVFVGLSDSYEDYYQCIRRSYRFGQARHVTAYVVLSDLERPIFANVLRKQREAEDMGREMVKHVAEFERAEIGGMGHDRTDYSPARQMILPRWVA